MSLGLCTYEHVPCVYRSCLGFLVCLSWGSLWSLGFAYGLWCVVITCPQRLTLGCLGVPLHLPVFTEPPTFPTGASLGPLQGIC